MLARIRDDRGSAVVEFAMLAVVLLIPIVYVMGAVITVSTASHAVTMAAREAGRAFATADDPSAGRVRAVTAAQLAASDQGLALGASAVVTTCLGGACLEPGSRVRATVTYTVRLPFLPVDGPGAVHIRSTHTTAVDRFREAL